MDKDKLVRIAEALQWEARYKTLLAGQAQPEYFLAETPGLDPDLADGLAAQNIRSGRVLDIGTGLGQQAILLARRGFDVVATDVAAHAIEQAIERQQQAGTHVTFVQDNILFTTVQGPFDLIVDRGCFTVISRPLKADYAAAIDNLLAPGGFFFLKVDYKIDIDLIRSLFQPALTLRAHQKSWYRNTSDVALEALFCVLQKPDPHS